MAQDFPGGPVVKKLPCNAGDVGSMLCPGTKTPHATEQLGLTLQLLSHIRKSTCNSERSYTTQLRFNAANQSINKNIF